MIYSYIHTYKHTYINDDYNQVQYVLSDKTGTLTQNHMILQTFSVAATTYESKSGSGIGSGGGSVSSGISPVGLNGGGASSNLEEDLGLHKNSITISPMAKSSHSCSPSLLPVVDALPLTGGHWLTTTYLPTYLYIRFQFFTHTCIHIYICVSAIQQRSVVDDELTMQLKLDFVRTLTYCHTAVLMPDAKGAYIHSVHYKHDVNQMHSAGDVNVTDASALKACMQVSSTVPHQ